MPGKLVPVAPIPMHPSAHVLHYASTCFEGFKAYRYADGSIHVFRMDRHMARLRQSAKLLMLPVPDEAHDWAREQLPGEQPTLLVSPCSSHPLRNWRPERYAAVADHAAATLSADITLEPGPRLRFGPLTIEGNQRIEPRTILTYAGIGRGEAVTAGELNDAYQRLQGSGLFEKVELKPQGGKLVIAVQEFPTVNVVAFEGNDRIKDEILQGLIKTQSRKIYSPAAVEADAALITKGYSDIGRMAATVTPNRRAMAIRVSPLATT